MDAQTQKLKAIRRLLGSFPEQARQGETLEQKAERLALATTGYLTALDGFDMDLIDTGVTLVLAGELPGYDGRFAPTPPMLATACRMAAERRSRQSYLNRLRTPSLPAPTIEHTPESRARIREMARGYVAEKSDEQLADATEESERQRAQWERVHARFQPDMSPEAVKARLFKPKWDVGAPESDEAAA